MRIVEQFIAQFGIVLSHANVSVVPKELANIQGFFEGLTRTGQQMTRPDVGRSTARP